MLMPLAPLICAPLVDPQSALPWVSLLALAVLSQIGVLVSLASKQRRRWPGFLSWGTGALALVALLASVVGWLRIRAQMDYFMRWCGSKLTSFFPTPRSLGDVYSQANDLALLFQRDVFVPVVILALSVVVAGVVLVAAHRGQRVPAS